ncbi:MAG TPA: hypothetical protein PKE63_12670 [Lacibacter sp.]|nr:hypothetical protein [Lacibacter sp.]HMO89241.1 hypothetical protein [Lacibacter sp.]HMP88125.1 hypothetical protein [Lacibacter sp.]
MSEALQLQNLLEQGPVVEAEIFPNVDSFLKLKNFGTPETFARVRLLVDTGSNISGLDINLIRTLQLPAYNDTEEWVRGQGGSWQVVRYGCVLYLPIFKKKALTIDVLEGHYEGSPFNGILGRDVLKFCDFRYDGQKNSFTLAARGF